MGDEDVSDRIIRAGFPDGWWVQDRMGLAGALLLRRADTLFGTVCVCMRPPEVTTEAWLPTARLIAKGIDMVVAASKRQRRQVDSSTSQ